MTSIELAPTHTHFFFINTPFFGAEAGKEIEITTNKVTTMSLNIGYF